MPEKLLITGCGLGATHYTARLLRRCGLDVGHERIREDGVVSWMHATWVDPVAVQQELTCGRWQWRYFGDPPSTDEFDLVLRQTRNPRRVATSIGMTASQKSWVYAKKALEARLDIDFPWPPRGDDEQRMEAGVAYTYWWYIYAGLHARWTYRVEDMPRVLPCILDSAGYQVSPDEQKNALQDVSTDAGGRQKDRGYDYWTWDEIEDVRWGPELHAMSRAFGYEE